VVDGAPEPGVHRALAPAKINLGLFLGPVRAGDGRHELVTVMQSISLSDELTLRAAPAGAVEDEVVCPGVPGATRENLAAAALRLFRERTGWRAPPLLLEIVKRIPVAAGLGGGSADAAAALRLASHASGLGDGRLLLELASELGADVPAQVLPGRWLATGAGERLGELPPPRVPFGVLVSPMAGVALSTAAVYAEADRLGLGRSMDALEHRRLELQAALAHGESLPGDHELLVNDLAGAAQRLCPGIAGALSRVREAGAKPALVSGSGPTVIGLFAPAGDSPEEGPARAREAAGRLAPASFAPASPAPWSSGQVACAEPVDGAFARAVTLRPGERRARASQSPEPYE
jgi:4-diphosphocytidyl-2-C-methyl-D-erythritol kinase